MPWRPWPVVSAAALLIATIPLMWTFPLAEAQAQSEALPEEVRLIESLNGAALYQAYCASCHGKDAKGGGPAAGALKTTPPDLTRIARRSGGKFPFSRIEKIIEGDDTILSHGSRAMPVWGPIFSQIAWDQDLGKVRIYNLTKYLESVQQK